MGGSGGDGSGDDREEDVDSEEEDPLRTLVERKAAARTAGPREDGGIKKRAKKKNKKKKSSRNAFANVSEAGGDKAAKVKTDGVPRLPAPTAPTAPRRSSHSELGAFLYASLHAFRNPGTPLCLCFFSSRCGEQRSSLRAARRHSGRRGAGDR